MHTILVATLAALVLTMMQPVSAWAGYADPSSGTKTVTLLKVGYYTDVLGSNDNGEMWFAHWTADGRDVHCGLAMYGGFGEGQAREKKARTVRTSDFASEELYRGAILTIYYGPGGPGYESLGKSLYPETVNGTRVTDGGRAEITHWLLSYYYKGKGNWHDTWICPPNIWDDDPQGGDKSGGRFYRWGADHLIPTGSGTKSYADRLLAHGSDADMLAHGGYTFADFASKVDLIIGGTIFQDWFGFNGEPPSKVAISLSKSSANPDLTNSNRCYSLAGAKYGVFASKADADGGDESKALAVMTTDAAGTAKTEEVLGPGDYWVRELKASRGYALDRKAHKVTAKAGEGGTVKVAEVPQSNPVRSIVQKLDKDTGEASPEGAGTLEGAEFTVRYYDGEYSISNLPAKATRTWVVKTDKNGNAKMTNGQNVSGDGFYKNSDGAVCVPIGTVTITETKAPVGYLRSNEVKLVQVKGDGSAAESVEHLNEAEAYPDKVIRGGVKVAKVDRDLDTNTAQGKATLAGAELEVVNRSANQVKVGDAVFGTDEVVLTLVTGDDGRAQSAKDALPYGDYTVRESKAPAGYNLNADWSADFQIRENGVVVDASGNPCDDPVMRGDIAIPKIDRELMEALPLGGATLEGAEFEVASLNDAPVVVGGATFSKGQVVCTVATGADGVATARALPYGDYSIRESKAPEGYLLNETWSASVQVREEGATVVSQAVDDQVKRGDIRFNKVREQGMDRLANVAFRITSKTTGESHVIVTDGNGMASTATSWNPHTQHTNASDAADRSDGTADAGKLDAEAGTWFNGRTDRETKPDDNLGALPYDTYAIEELRSEANEGLKLVSFEFRVMRDSTELDMGTLDDPPCTLQTELVGANAGTHYVPATGTVRLVDTVFYEGLKPGERYTLEGRLVDGGSGEELVAQGAKASVELAPKTSSGSAEVTFEIDTAELAGRSVIAFERALDASGTEVAKHEDLGDEDQTVRVPALATELAAADGSRDGAVKSGETILVDRVDYTGLEPGIEHVAKGELHGKNMDGSDAGPLIGTDGEPVTAEAAFTPDSPNGSAAVEFRFDATSIESPDVVAFQEIWRGGERWAEHADIADESQTIALTPPPAIEKYVERDVHHSVAKRGEAYSYAVMAYVTADAEAITIFDELVAGLEFAHGAEEVRVSDMGTENNHKVAGAYSATESDDAATVASEGADITGDCEVSLEGQLLTVKVPGLAEKGLRGHWLRVTFAARIADDAQWTRIEENGAVLSSESHVGIPNTARYRIDGKDAPGKHEVPSNTVTVSEPQEPAIEKYVNRDVHKSLEGFDEVFTYDVMAYITRDATAATISDELVGEIELASGPEGVRVADMGPANNHLPYGAYSEKDRSDEATVAAEGTDIAGSCHASIDGKKLTVKIDDATAYRGHWVCVTFEAKLSGTSGTVGIEENAPVLSGMSHEGIPNKASYAIDTDDRPNAYNLESNTVTVMPPLKPAIEKYVNRDVHESLESLDDEFTYDVMAYMTPDATSACITDDLVDSLVFACKAGEVAIADMGTANNHRVSGAYSEKDRADDATVGAEGAPIADSCDISIDGQRLSVTIPDATPYRGHWVRVTFRARAISAGGFEAISDNAPVLSGKAHEGIPNKAAYRIGTADNPQAHSLESNTVTVAPPDKPAIEKYVSKDVHQELGSRDESFTYDVMAYITSTADSVTITDELVASLAFADDAGSAAIEDMGIENNHRVNGVYSAEEKSEEATVSAPGTDIRSACKVSIDGQKLIVEIPDASAYRGHWVRVAFAAKAIAAEGYQAISDNGAVLSGKAHLGIPNRASYEIRSGDSPAMKVDSNIVTVRPPEEPAIEKYVGKDVHQDLKGLSDTFTYDVMAYVPADAVAITVTDELATNIELAGKAEDVRIAGPIGNNHRTNGVFSKASQDASVTEKAPTITDKASVSIEGRKLTVTIPDTQALELNGAWVRVTFQAKASSGDGMVEVSDNGTVVSDKSHMGIPNTASYTADASDKPGAYAAKSNTVTVAPPNTPQPDKKATHSPQHEQNQKAPIGSFFAKAGNLLARYWPIIALLCIGIAGSSAYLLSRRARSKRLGRWQ